MGKIAFVFSGQGAQHPGMAKDFYDNILSVHELFTEAEQIREGTLRQCFEDSAEILRQTENTQPCLYLADLAAAMALKEIGIVPAAVAGFSLGEIPALAFAGAFSDILGFRIACRRGEVMAEATRKTEASMLAVLKLTNSQVDGACKEYEQVYPVNYNCPGQVVVSGKHDELERFQERIRLLGGKTMKLAVSGGFHSPFMDSAAKNFGAYLSEVEIGTPKIAVYSNYTAAPYGENAAVLMENQINHPVKWEAIIQGMVSRGIDTFIEVGVGNVLQKLIARITPQSRAFSVENMEGVTAILKEVGSLA